MIAYADSPTTWSYRMADGATQQVNFRPANAVSDSTALQPILVGGGGIGRLSDFSARDAVASGDLVRLFPDTKGDMFGVHALYTHTEERNTHVIEMNLKLGYREVRRGPIWDEIVRVSLIKRLD